MQSKKFLKKVIIILGWILLWQLAAVLAGSPVFFAGPLQTLQELGRQALTSGFWQAVAASLFRILAGFVLAFILAYASAWLAFCFGLAEEILEPFVTLLRSVPVAAVTVVLLLWTGSRSLVFWIGFMVVYPNIYGTMLTALKNTPKKQREMAGVFGFRSIEKLCYIYRPSYLPALCSSVSYSLGMSFKSGVAAEVIGLPEQGIGTRLYMDKIYINTAGIFAWMAVILLLSALCTKLAEGLLALAGRSLKQVRVRRDKGEVLPAAEIELSGIFKSFDGKELYGGRDFAFERGGIYCIMGASGSGKTTLLRILCGLGRADAGEIRQNGKLRAAVCFQEDRLVEECSAEGNILLGGAGREETAEALEALFPEEVRERAVKELSGGERRRVALLRALLAPGNLLLLDEPFAGLDEKRREQCLELIRSRRRGRTLILVSHEEADARALGAQIIIL